MEQPAVSGERFEVVYRLQGGEDEARKRAAAICLEQTVEFPLELVPNGTIRDEIVGQIVAVDSSDNTASTVTISYAVETTAFELTQLLNVVFGNISIQPGIRLESLRLSPALLHHFRGPRWGRVGLRDIVGVHDRPLLCTALKPMGLNAAALADQAFRFALGGIDVVKDDHGLTDQPFAPFGERVRACVEAIGRANAQTGGCSIYVANVTAPADQIVERARLAKAAGAGGIMVAPGITGLDTMRRLADDDAIALPILSHPAFQGCYVTNPTAGIAHGALFGQIARLAGADASIYPNYGGRFSFSQLECLSINAAAAEPMGGLKPIFPAPGGGMSIERVPDMLALYGRDVMLLIGGGLHTHSPDLVANCREFVRLVSPPQDESATP